MYRCSDAAIFVIFFYLLIPVKPACDTNDTLAQYHEKFCNLPKIVGSCKLKWKRFYFNRYTKQCEQFVYEGEREITSMSFID